MRTRVVGPGLLLVVFASAAVAGDVVLVGVDAGDPYHAAAEKMARHWRTDAIVRFDPERPDAIVPRLRELAPERVVLVLRPEQIHVNSVRRFLKASTTIDDDPFVDFDYGFVTGATAKEAIVFVENIVRASRKGSLPRKVGQAAVWGGARPCQSKEGTYAAGRLSFPMRSLIFADPEGKHGRDQEFIDAHLRDLQGCGAIIMGGHGMPWEIGSGPRAEDVDRLRLFPAVAFNYACHTGVTQRYPERKWEGGGYLFKLLEVDMKRSFALAMIRTGVVGYVAYVNPRPAGPEVSIDFQRVLAGGSLGAVRRNDYAKIVLGYLGYGEPGIVVGDFEDGLRKPRSEVDPVRHMMLDGATGGILYGDPSYRPFAVARDALPLRTRVTRKGDELHVSFHLEARMAFVWGADPFRRFDDESMAMKVYDRVEIPEGLPEIRSVRITAATRAGQPIKTLPPVWAIEEDRGKRYLHLKANFARAGRGDVDVSLVASHEAAKDPAPPEPEVTRPPKDPVPPKAEPEPPARVYDLSRREDCLEIARQAGAHVVERRGEAEGGNVYEGAAGIALFLFDLHAATGEKSWLVHANEMLEKALETVGGDSQPGLHVGAAGVGQACLHAWRATRKKVYLDRARDCAKGLGEPTATDVISGAAGIGFFLLDLHETTKEERWLARARKLGDGLAAATIREKRAASWPVRPGTTRVYVGYSHGAAGIGAFFVRLHRATKDPTHRQLAEAAARFVLRHATKDGEDGLKWHKLVPPLAPDKFPVQWCHGSPGIGLFFADLVSAYGKAEYRRALLACAASTLREGRTSRVTGVQCHGVAGNAELLIDAFQVTKDRAWLEGARRFGADLVDSHGLRTKVGSWSYGPSYMVGMAGVGEFFLRLADPAKFPLALHPSR